MTTNIKNDIKHHELCKKSSIYSYRQKDAVIPNNCEFVTSFENKKTGFYADVLKCGDKIIIAYRGTQFNKPSDIRNDIAMSRSRIPAQATDALKAYDEIKRMYPNAEITVTGHSLGGSLAQIVSAIRGVAAVTFNAYGTKNMFKDPQNLKEGNIVNYVNENDIITMENGENHLGTTYAVEHISGFAHKVESMGDLSKRIERSSKELKRNWERLHPRADKINQKIDDFFDRKRSVQDVLSKSLGQHSSSNCPGSYMVNGYIRSDGVKVDDYIRSCGVHSN